MHKQTNQVYYTGQWFNECPNGIGIMTCANYEFANLQSKELQWTKYEGEFTNGYFNGKGKCSPDDFSLGWSFASLPIFKLKQVLK